MAAYANRVVWMDGQLIPAEQASVSIFDHGLLYGDGVFEGIRLYNGRVLKLRTHLKRLYDSARAIRLRVPYTADGLFDAVKETCAANGLSDAYIRLVFTRGVGTLGINPFTCPTPRVFIIAASIQLYPEEFYTNGLKVISSSFIRNHPQALSPRIKSLNYLNNVLAKIEAVDAGVLEAVMYNHEGTVAECTADNLFLVRNTPHGPVLLTPPLSAGCLEGVTRNLVIELAEEAGLTTRQEPLTRHDLYVADEMFATGTGAEVIPIVDIDGRPLGPPESAGAPGPTTKKLIRAFREMVKRAPED